MKTLFNLVVALFVMIAIIACSNSTLGLDAETTGTENLNTEDVPAAFAAFSDDVTIYVDGNYAVLESNGVPNHSSPYLSTSDSRYAVYNGTNSNFALNPNRIAEQSFVFRIPLNPAEAGNHQNSQLGPIGISINGVPFYNQYAGPNIPLTQEINSFDQYNGHPQQTGQYHYHVEPLYLTANSGKEGLLGFLLDGFPVYGPEENGSAVTNSDLDQYHGHFSATSEYPGGIYHYHVTNDDPYINGGQYFGTPGFYTN